MSDLQELKPAIAAFVPAQSQLLFCRVGSPSSSASHKKPSSQLQSFSSQQAPLKGGLQEQLDHLIWLCILNRKFRSSALSGT